MVSYIFERYEKKYLLNKEKLNRILPKLLDHMDYDEYCPNGKRYVIYNLYCDNDNGDIVRNCSLYPEYKEKLRIRSYGIPKKNDLIFLEIKRKSKGKVSKRRISLTSSETKDFIENKIEPTRTNYLDKQIIKEIKYYLETSKVRPVMFLGYERLALFGENNLRITIDNGLKTRHKNITLNDTTGNYIFDDDQYIMEIKIFNAIPLWLVKILSDEKIYSQGFSKYGYDAKLESIKQKDGIVNE